MGIENPDILNNSLALLRYREYWTDRTGRVLLLRPITAQDKQIERELIDGLSPQSSRSRFFRWIKKASETMVDQFCKIDYTSEIAILAVYELNGRIKNVGVVRLYIEPDQQTGEFAVVVADDFQGCGLGKKFMRTLIDVGREKGLKSIYGIVLAGNNRMLNLVKRLGFSIGDSEDGEVTIILKL